MQELNMLKQYKKNNFGLSEEDFLELVDRLKKGDDKLFERIYLSHFEYCVKYLVKYQDAPYEAAYTSTMNALIEIRQDLIHDKIQYGNLSYIFTYRAGKKLSKIRKRGNSKLKVVGIGEMDFVDKENLFNQLQSKEMKEIINKAFNKIGEECKQLLKLYYYDDLSWAKIARIHFPTADTKTITRKGDTFKKRAKRKCLPTFKAILANLIS